MKVQQLKPPASAPSQPITSNVKTLLDNLDPAYRRVAFVGFPVEMVGSENTKHIENYLKQFPA